MNEAQGNSVAIAVRFLDLFLKQEGLRRWQQVCERNRKETEANVCHTHDFCDANMLMEQAFEELFLSVDVENEADRQRWNAAWDVAFRITCGHWQ